MRARQVPSPRRGSPRTPRPESRISQASPSSTLKAPIASRKSAAMSSRITSAWAPRSRAGKGEGLAAERLHSPEHVAARAARRSRASPRGREADPVSPGAPTPVIQEDVDQRAATGLGCDRDGRPALGLRQAPRAGRARGVASEEARRGDVRLGERRFSGSPRRAGLGPLLVEDPEITSGAETRATRSRAAASSPSSDGTSAPGPAHGAIGSRPARRATRGRRRSAPPDRVTVADETATPAHDLVARSRARSTPTGEPVVPQEPRGRRTRDRPASSRPGDGRVVAASPRDSGTLHLVGDPWSGRAPRAPAHGPGAWSRAPAAGRRTIPRRPAGRGRRSRPPPQRPGRAEHRPRRPDPRQQEDASSPGPGRGSPVPSGRGPLSSGRRRR